jgi:hypothetical protein
LAYTLLGSQGICFFLSFFFYSPSGRPFNLSGGFLSW